MAPRVVPRSKFTVPRVPTSRTSPLSGDDALTRLLAIGDERINQLAGQSLYEEALEIFRASQNVVPVATGILRASGHVTLPEQISLHESTVTIGYGGAASSYAGIVHEKLSTMHAPGKTAKYLERPVSEHMDVIENHLARRIVGKIYPEGVFR